uniref:Uncharacterized protein n=1 Tax=Ciona intestinalis TaxID=7719 RepID=H2XZR4_CIOIN
MSLTSLLFLVFLLRKLGPFFFGLGDPFIVFGELAIC